jgi:hypothetical protein
MFIDIPKDGYWFDEDNIRIIENKYQARYVGYWCTKKPRGGWNESPVDVFYVENPDRSQGHTNYFGMFRDHDNVLITDASSAFSEKITGILCEDGEVIVSRYRHDYVTNGDNMIDGGRDYLKCSVSGKMIEVRMVGGEFLLMTEENAQSGCAA